MSAVAKTIENAFVDASRTVENAYIGAYGDVRKTKSASGAYVYNQGERVDFDAKLARNVGLTLPGQKNVQSELYKSFFENLPEGMTAARGRQLLSTDLVSRGTQNADGSWNEIKKARKDAAEAKRLQEEFDAFEAGLNPEKKKKDYMSLITDMPGRDSTLLTSGADFSKNSLIGGR